MGIRRDSDTASPLYGFGNQQIQAWLPSPYQVASILTENLGGKYNADSYIWDENIAKADIKATAPIETIPVSCFKTV